MTLMKKTTNLIESNLKRSPLGTAANNFDKANQERFKKALSKLFSGKRNVGNDDHDGEEGSKYRR